MKKVSFIETTSNNLENLSLKPGRFIFTTDTHNLYLDLETIRTAVGGANIIDTLARPSDWNETDPNSISYIKNKPIAMPASDVYSWAKENSKPSYTAEEVGADSVGSAQTAEIKAKTYTDNRISNLINGAPETLDTLKEVADAIKENEDIVDALNKAISNKLTITDITQTVTSSIDDGLNIITIALSDGTTSTFSVKNGSKGATGPQGLKGDKGDKGDTGPRGAAGTNATTTAVASTSANGLMSSTDKTKLNGISTGANKVTFTISGNTIIITTT